MTTTTERVTVRLQGLGWRVEPRADLRLVGLTLTRHGETQQHVSPETARAIAAALTAAADEIEARR